jgi:hypothetical protein
LNKKIFSIVGVLPWLCEWKDYKAVNLHEHSLGALACLWQGDVDGAIAQFRNWQNK